MLLFCTYLQLASSWGRSIRNANNLTDQTQEKNETSTLHLVQNDTHNYNDGGNNTIVPLINSTLEEKSKTENNTVAVNSTENKVIVNKIVNTNDDITTESNGIHTKLEKFYHHDHDVSDDYDKEGKDDNIAVESKPTKNEDKPEDADSKFSTFPSGKSQTGRSIEFDFDGYSPPDFQNKNNLYTISVANDDDKHKHEFDEKFEYKEPDFSKFFESTTEYTIPHDDFFDKIHRHDDDFDHEISDTEISETKDRTSFDITNDRFSKPLEAEFSEPKRTSPFDVDLDVDKMKKNDNDTKVGLDFLKFKRVENQGKKDKNGIRKNFVSEKRTSIDYNSSFNKTEIIGDKKEAETQTEKSSKSEGEGGSSDSVDTTTHKTLIYHQTTKRSTILTKPPALNDSHVPLLNNKIEKDKIKPVEATTVESVFTNEGKISRVIPIPAATTKSEETSTLRKFQTTTPFQTSTESYNGNKETVNNVQPKNTPINVSKRGSVKFNSPTTEIPRFRNSSITTQKTLVRPSKISTRYRLNQTKGETGSADDGIQPLTSEVNKSFANPLPVDGANETTTSSVEDVAMNTETLTTSSTTSAALTTAIAETTTTRAKFSRLPPRRVLRPVNRRIGTVTNSYSPATITEITTQSTTDMHLQNETADLQTTTTEEAVTSSIHPSTTAIDNDTMPDITTLVTKYDSTTTQKSSTEIVIDISTETTLAPTEKTEIPLHEYDDVSYSSEVSYSSSVEIGSTPSAVNITNRTSTFDNDTTVHVVTEVNNTYIVTENDTDDETTSSSEILSTSAEVKHPATHVPTLASTESASSTGNTEITSVDNISTASAENTSIASPIESSSSTRTTSLAENGGASVVTDDYDNYDSDGNEDSSDHSTHIPEIRIQPVDKNPDQIKNNDLYETTNFVSSDNSVETTTNFELQRPKDDDNSGTIAAITISCIGAICLILLAGLLIIMRKRQKRFNYGQRCTPVSLDAYSMDNVSVYNSVRRKAIRSSKRSYGNPAFEDPSSVTHPLNFPALAKFATNVEDMTAEFEEIPQVTARTNELPEGCDTKNRYANVIPLPETRVFLTPIEGYPNSDYINANYVTVCCYKLHIIIVSLLY